MKSTFGGHFYEFEMCASIQVWLLSVLNTEILCSGLLTPVNTDRDGWIDGQTDRQTDSSRSCWKSPYI